MAPRPKILWNNKDHPLLPSGYAIMGRYLLPLLGDHYGRENIIIYAPVYQREYMDKWEDMLVVPGVTFDFGENYLLEHYRHHKCNILIQIGDAWGLGLLPDMAARDQILWVQWLAVDWLGMPKNIIYRIKPAYKLVPFSKDGEAKLRRAGLTNVEKAIWLGLNTELWQPMEPNPSMMRLLGFSPETFNILMVSANQERKAIRQQLEGIATFRRVHTEAQARLYIHTTMKRDRDLFADIDELNLGDITYYPEEYLMSMGGIREEEMVLMYNACDVVLNACHEGFGYSTLQAQAVGKPVVYLHEGPSPELVKYGVGITDMYLFTGANQMCQAFPQPLAVAQALGIVWGWKKEGKRLFSQKAVDFVRDNFDWKRIAKQWIEVIDRAMEDRERFCMDIPSSSNDLERRSFNEVVVL